MVCEWVLRESPLCTSGLFRLLLRFALCTVLLVLQAVDLSVQLGNELDVLAELDHLPLQVSVGLARLLHLLLQAQLLLPQLLQLLLQRLHLLVMVLPQDLHVVLCDPGQQIDSDRTEASTRGFRLMIQNSLPQSRFVLFLIRKDPLDLIKVFCQKRNSSQIL